MDRRVWCAWCEGGWMREVLACGDGPPERWVPCPVCDGEAHYVPVPPDEAEWADRVMRVALAGFLRRRGDKGVDRG